MTLAVMILAFAMQQYTQWPSCSIGDAHTAPATEEGCKKVGGTFHLGRLANYHGGKEPMDVPAVHVPMQSILEFINGCPPGAGCAPVLQYECSNNGTMDEHGQCKEGWRWGCDDKSRILLTSEDGKKHCILFPK